MNVRIKQVRFRCQWCLSGRAAERRAACRLPGPMGALARGAERQAPPRHAGPTIRYSQLKQKMD